ncbi:Dialkylrecorsinol condensing enzyme [hydrothermal vent metagenome]|uniref:Dialkylrecorsinol condensing enzyme n=1 Tax=hydrothermal vent metagenome TaxID=652676 RepID=A0A3B0ZRX7_9ZZZZ
MRRVLVVHYSQTGQLTEVVKAFTQPLLKNPEIEVTFECIEPEVDYPFPWPFLKFFRIFPETVYMQPPRMKPYSIASTDKFDLIILAYQVWFLSPSLPTTAFLRSELAKNIFKGTPVITLIACRDMWLMAQEKVKKELQHLEARLIDNVALVDECGSALSFLSTPLWMFTGSKGPRRFSPKAGVSTEDIKNCDRFGKRIAQALNSSSSPLHDPLLQGLGAVKIKEKIIATEVMAHRSFLLWGKLLRAMGEQDSLARAIGLCFYIVFLIFLILTVVPISALIKKLLSPLTKKHIEKQKLYYSQPSGEGRLLILGKKNE